MRARPSARVILVDGRNRVLLLRVEDPPNLGEGDFWILPGCGLKQGETFEEAARRELREETGIRNAMWGPCVWTRELRLTLNGGDILSLVVRQVSFAGGRPAAAPPRPALKHRAEATKPLRG